MGSVAKPVHREPWNKGKIVGQKAPFKLKDIWALGGSNLDRRGQHTIDTSHARTDRVQVHPA